ncbi:MAG TPA: SGNH/GDSL hydrolase family protein [Candidatus Sulfotelmatobacter sp.]|nr:SGNH/GDSL hydrolase family protein [Candidatus Sulfotelmatobacter sp.]
MHRSWPRAACLALIVALGVVTAGCSASHDTCGGGATCTRVLFIGNSYTYTNDLPGTFVALAQSGGHPVAADSVAEGGATLADANTSDATATKLAATQWGFVVLQEQSEIPSLAWSRDNEMYPAARALVARVKAVNSTPVFFMTWAHEAGWPENGLPDYLAMQQQIDAGYVTIAQQLGVPEAPVGYAWARVHRADPALALWIDDGSHPTAAGTYLAACVFYATIFRQSPNGLSWTDGLSGADAQLIQATATTAVFSPAQAWLSP